MRHIRVMTFNIHHAKGTDGTININRIAKVIKKSNPDIIGLNEVDQAFHHRSSYKDQPHLLSELLQMQYAFTPAVDAPSSQGGYGNAVLSRFPIERHRSTRLKAGGDAREPRVLLEADVNCGGEAMTVYVTHLSLNPWHHRKQTEEIMSITSQCKHPHVILGDWNMRPGSRPWRRLTEAYTDSWHVAGQGKGATFPSGRPFVRLDYIFASPHYDIVQSQVESSLQVASDHLPIWCDIQW
jgi:endonuclease/exonuclease/phosphatase family metal-dependent hydrolase